MLGVRDDKLGEISLITINCYQIEYNLWIERWFYIMCTTSLLCGIDLLAH